MAFVYGHFLNREEIHRRLRHLAQRPATDAELLLAAYEYWGAAAAQELEGSYVAVVWDELNDRLFCVRDTIGRMPLYYAATGAGLILSSDIWTVLRHPEVSREINRPALAEHLLWCHPRVEETCFAGVRRLPEAHSLVAKGPNFTIACYWDPYPPPGQPIDWLSQDELDAFPALLRRTLDTYMALGPTGVTLSPGIDSVSVAALAVEASEQGGRQRPYALAVHFDAPRWDESAGQRAAADALAMPSRFLSASECLDGRPLLEAMVALSPTYPFPLSNIWEPILLHLTEVAQRYGLRVLLTGIGGDEWLGVTPPPVLQKVASRCFSRWVSRRARAVALPSWIAPDPALRRELQDRLAVPCSTGPAESRHTRALRRMLERANVALLMEGIHYRSRGRGVCYYHPYWSRPVLEQLLRTPLEMLNAGARTRGLVRRTLGDRLPQLDRHRQRNGDRNPFFRQAVVQQWPGFWARWASDSVLARAGIADARRMEPAMQAATSAGRWHPILWLSSEAWLRAR
jgi:asparagine synthetase B (glutamine-hydrolysing)